MPHCHLMGRFWQNLPARWQNGYRIEKVDGPIQGSALVKTAIKIQLKFLNPKIKKDSEFCILSASVALQIIKIVLIISFNFLVHEMPNRTLSDDCCTKIRDYISKLSAKNVLYGHELSAQLKNIDSEFGIIRFIRNVNNDQASVPKTAQNKLNKLEINTKYDAIKPPVKRIQQNIKIKKDEEPSCSYSDRSKRIKTEHNNRNVKKNRVLESESESDGSDEDNKHEVARCHKSVENTKNERKIIKLQCFKNKKFTLANTHEIYEEKVAVVQLMEIDDITPSAIEIFVKEPKCKLYSLICSCRH